jgi:hypothetical protein
MSGVRAGIRQLAREIGVPSVNGNCACPGLPVPLHFIREGDPIPDPPACLLCGKPHWPDPSVQAICIVIEAVVRTREEVEHYREGEKRQDAP